MLRVILPALALALFISPVHAQLGGLRKRAEKAVAGKVAPQTNMAGRQKPTFDDAVLELTDERISRLLVGFAAEAKTAAKIRDDEAQRERREATYRQQRDEFDRAQNDWQKKNAAWEKCMEKYQAEADARGQESQKFVQSTDTMKLKAIALRIQTAQARGDMAEARRLTDSLTAIMSAAVTRYGTADIEKRARAECGDRPEELEPPEAPGQPVSQSTLTDGARAAGIPEEQYRIARERVLAWLSLGDDRITRGETKYAFTDAELTALNARRADLRQYEKLLQTY